MEEVGEWCSCISLRLSFFKGLLYIIYTADDSLLLTLAGHSPDEQMLSTIKWIVLFYSPGPIIGSPAYLTLKEHKVKIGKGGQKVQGIT